MAEAAHPALHDVEARRAIIHDTATISSRAVVGAPGEWHDHPTEFHAVVCAGVVVREMARVHAGCLRDTRVGANTLIMSGAHIGHDAIIGERCDIAPNAVIGGGAEIGDDTKIGMGAIVNPYIHVGANARIGAGAVVTKNVPNGETWAGVPAKRLHAWKGDA